MSSRDGGFVGEVGPRFTGSLSASSLVHSLAHTPFFSLLHFIFLFCPLLFFFSSCRRHLTSLLLLHYQPARASASAPNSLASPPWNGGVGGRPRQTESGS